MRRATTLISMLVGALLSLALVVDMVASGQGTSTAAEAAGQLPRTGVELHPADLGETTRNWLGRSQFDAGPYLPETVG